jgi:ATP-dependent DNA ligase
MAIRARAAAKTAAQRSRAGVKLHFIESMECLPVAKLPEGPEWTYEIKLDGYRLEALKEPKETRLYSRRANLLNAKFPYLAAALSKLPNATILDGEVVALDAKRRSDFNLVQNFRSAETIFTTTPSTSWSYGVESCCSYRSTSGAKSWLMSCLPTGTSPCPWSIPDP